MQQHEYDKMVNYNTVKCWSIIATVLFFSYIMEIVKGVRSVGYVVTFCIIMFIPLMISIITYINHGTSKAIKIQFAIGYSIFYLFTLCTTQSPAAFVYIVPMASVMIAYCSEKLIFGVFGNALIVNIAVIIYKYHNDEFLMIPDSKMAITFWEIQIACIFLTGLFLYFSMTIIKKRNDVIKDVLDDIYKDALTGIDNVRFINDNEYSLFDFKRNDKLCIAFIDIDNFKHFNTNYGHSFGDMVLKRLAYILSQAVDDVRHTYAIRNGGDEFLIISRTTSDDEFKNMLEFIRKEVELTKLPYNNRLVGITISIGMATKSLDNDTCDNFRDLYNKADARNQLAKDSGKNSIVS